RSSALIIFDHVVGSDLYRMRQAPSVFNHVLDVIAIACRGFNEHVPLAERGGDAMSMFARHRVKQKIRRLVPGRTYTDYGPSPRACADLPLRQQLTALRGTVRSQLPRHSPADEDLPVLADEWFTRFDAGYDVTRWYTAETAAS